MVVGKVLQDGRWRLLHRKRIWRVIQNVHEVLVFARTNPYPIAAIAAATCPATWPHGRSEYAAPISDATTTKNAIQNSVVLMPGRLRGVTFDVWSVIATNRAKRRSTAPVSERLKNRVQNCRCDCLGHASHGPPFRI